MIKLSRLLEIKNTSPSRMRNKIFDYFKDNHPHLLGIILDNINAGKRFDVVPDSIVDNTETWETYLEKEYGYEENFIPQLIVQIKQLYTTIRPGEAEIISLESGEDMKKVSIVSSKFLEVINDENTVYLILTNF